MYCGNWQHKVSKYHGYRCQSLKYMAWHYDKSLFTIGVRVLKSSLMCGQNGVIGITCVRVEK